MGLFVVCMSARSGSSPGPGALRSSSHPQQGPHAPSPPAHFSHQDQLGSPAQGLGAPYTVPHSGTHSTLWSLPSCACVFCCFPQGPPRHTDSCPCIGWVYSAYLWSPTGCLPHGGQPGRKGTDLVSYHMAQQRPPLLHSNLANKPQL